MLCSDLVSIFASVLCEMYQVYCKVPVLYGVAEDLCDSVPCTACITALTQGVSLQAQVVQK